jgi:hypothetical protein
MRLTVLPTFPDLVAAALLLWMFAAGNGWGNLLSDGDTGWHIRNGEQIVDSRSVPRVDSYGFDSGNRPWYAWEWLSDAAFALLFRAGGLRLVVLGCAVAIALAVSIAMRHALWAGLSPVAALGLTLLANTAASSHYLARPHVFTLLFFAISAWMIACDRAARGRWIWLLPAIVAVWTNLHGGFAAVFTLLGARIIEDIFRRREALFRSVSLFLLCAGSTFLNPYGWKLHLHLVSYLRSDWILSFVSEFQSPKFRSENMAYFEILLIAGLILVAQLLREGRIYESILTVVWAHAALTSVRHVPVFCLAVLPIAGPALERMWSGWTRSLPARSLVRAVDAVGRNWTAWTRGASALVPVTALAIALSAPAVEARDFPASTFPVEIVSRNTALLSIGGNRIFSSDQWSDYLIFRFQPRFHEVRVFMDGRSDFFQAWRGEDYLKLARGEPGSAEVLEAQKVHYALVPAKWPLEGLLSLSPRWKLVDADRQASLFVFIAKTEASKR